MADEGKPLGIDRIGFIEIDRTRRTADQIIRMRILASKDRVNPDDFLLPLESLQIMRHRHEIRLGRELVGRMSPVTIGKNPQLPALHKFCQALLHIGKIAR